MLIMIEVNIFILILVCLLSYSNGNSIISSKANDEFIPGKVTIISAENIGKFLNKQPSLLEFKASWCGHCKVSLSILT